MSYVIWARGEDGTEFRAWDEDFDTMEEAAGVLPSCEENWPDATFRIEELWDKAYYMKRHQERYDADEQDLY